LSVRFNQLHEKDKSRIEVRRVCTAENEEVPWEDVARGYEMESGEIVMLTDEELDAGRSQEDAHDRHRGVRRPRGDRPDLLRPPLLPRPDSNEAAVRAYHLLRTVMERSGQVAIARFVLRTKEYLVAVRTRGDAITLTTMLFHDEVRTPDEVGSTACRRPRRPRWTRRSRSSSRSQRDFDPCELRRRSTASGLLAIVEKKKKGQQIEIPDEPEAPKGRARPDGGTRGFDPADEEGRPRRARGRRRRSAERRGHA
jgi:DNA end-binding protein Ku